MICLACYKVLFCQNLQVTGELLDHLSSWDALRAALPVGTVSGAPKVLQSFCTFGILII